MGGLPGCDQLDKRHIWEHQKANVPATEGNGRNGLDDAFRPDSFQTHLLNIEIGRLIREVVEADAFGEPRREYAGLGVVAKELRLESARGYPVAGRGNLGPHADSRAWRIFALLSRSYGMPRRYGGTRDRMSRA